MRTVRRARWRGLPLFAFGGVVLLGLAAVTITVVTTITNSEPGMADGGNITRSVSVTETGTVTDVNVTVDFHKIPNEQCSNPGASPDPSVFSNEIELSLRSPSGTRVILTRSSPPTYLDPFAPGERVQVTFDDSAGQSVRGPRPMTGTFRPVRRLSAFNGEPAAGNWTLTIGDAAAGDALCFYAFTLEVTSMTEVQPTPTQGGSATTEPGTPGVPTATPAPGGNPATPTPRAPVLCKVNDGSLNAYHCGRPIAIYVNNGAIHIYGIDINTGWGAVALALSPEELADAGTPAESPLLLGSAENPYNHQPITLYRLPGGEFQVNTLYWDGKPYVVTWAEGADTVRVLEW